MTALTQFVWNDVKLSVPIWARFANIQTRFEGRETKRSDTGDLQINASSIQTLLNYAYGPGSPSQLHPSYQLMLK